MSPVLEMMVKEYDASTVDDDYSDVSPIYSLAQRPEAEVSRSQRHSWDICEKLLPRVNEYDSFQQWPDGHCKFVYSAADDVEAGRHMSGWAMRNTNNHNALVLKKSCLGVLACSRPCLDADSRPIVNLRPAICDKARAKQIGRPCPTHDCDGHLLLKPCEGHGGYPVTHFWRTANNSIYFQSKGSHSHQRPVRFWPLVERRQRTTNNDNNNKRQPLAKVKKFVKKSRSESDNSEVKIPSKSKKTSSSSASLSSSSSAAAAAGTLNSFDCNFPMYSPAGTKYSEWSRDAAHRPPGPVSRGFRPETSGQRLLITTGTGSDWEHGIHLNATYEEQFWIRQHQDQGHDHGQGQGQGQGDWQPIYQRNYDQGSVFSKNFTPLQTYHHHHHHHRHPCSSSSSSSREHMHPYGINRPLKVEGCLSCYDVGPAAGLSSSSSGGGGGGGTAVRFVASNDAEGSFFPTEMDHYWNLQQPYDTDSHLASCWFSEPSSYVTPSHPSFYEQKALMTSSPSMFDSYIPLDTLHVLDPEQVEEEFRRMEPLSMEFNCQMQQQQQQEASASSHGGHFQLKTENQK